MRLRKQLFLVSLITLSLPWVGCQYIQELESSLNKGQSDALNATATAIAARIHSDAGLLEELGSRAHSGVGIPIYLHPLNFKPLVDGYSEEWSGEGLLAQDLSPSRQTDFEPASVNAATHDGKLYLLLESQDISPQYFVPSSSPEKSDHLRLWCTDEQGQTRAFIVYATGPGNLHIDKIEAGTGSVREHRITGHWNALASGHKLELALPLEWAIGGLALTLSDIDVNSTKALQWTNKASVQSNATPPVIQSSQLLAEVLDVFTREGVRLKLASRDAALIAEAGSLSSKPADNSGSWVFMTMYRIAKGREELPLLNNEKGSGYFRDQEVKSALSGESSSARYQHGAHQVSRSAVPIHTPDGHSVLGAVIAEQNAQTLSNFTSNAFSRLMIYSVLVSSLAAVVLVLYATWLSLRIGLLNRATSNAISESGMIADQFKASKQPDEIGELSRNFSKLLMRLKEYTNYLKTLSSKLSHELRTPLAIVSSSLDNLEHEKLPASAKVFAARAKEGTSRLSNILNAMSAASRVEQAIGAAELEQIPVDEVLTSLKDAYKDVYRHVKFTLKIQDHKAGFEVLGAGELLVQMLDKLVDNAADFCPQGGMIEFGLYRHEDEVVITVRNEGPPLPQTMHKQLFDSMVSVRDKDPLQEKGHHLGLGLYIVRLIVDFHQGKVSAYNVPDNSGVIFEIRLPAG